MLRVFLLVLLLGGCAFVITPLQSSLPPSQKQLTADLLPPAPPSTLVEARDQEKKDYQRFYLSIQDPLHNDPLQATYWKSKEPERKKLVIVVPIYGGSQYPSEIISLRLTEWSDNADTNVLLIDNSKNLFDWSEVIGAENEATFQAALERWVDRVHDEVERVRLLISWAETQPEIDIKRIGIVGSSMGSLVAGIAAQIDWRISVMVLVMASGNPHEILEHATLSGAISLREAVQKKFGWSGAVLREKTRDALWRVNLAAYPSRFDPSQVLLLDAKYDEYMPQSGRDALWRALRQSKRITFQHGHRMSFLSFTPLGNHLGDVEVAKFFNEKL